jgi:hypothetical protein
MHKLISRYTVIVATIVFFGCKEPCLDMALINDQTIEMQSWYTNTEVETKTATSSIGISDEVNLVHDFHNFGDTIWDDCGNATDSERSIVRYDFFNFAFSLETEFHKQGEENGFQFIVRYNTLIASYKFTSESSSSTNAIVPIMDYELNGTTYAEAFKITYNQTQNESEIRELIFVIDLGIIHITLVEGITIGLN